MHRRHLRRPQFLAQPAQCRDPALFLPQFLQRRGEPRAAIDVANTRAIVGVE